MEKVRVDKWLWSVRIFKSRSLSTDQCKSGQIRINEKAVKPSFLIERGMRIHVKKEGFDLQFEVVDLIEKRVGAPLAVKCYNNLTSESEMNKYKDWFIGKAQPERRERGSGRPTKKERREIDDFKDWF